MRFALPGLPANVVFDGTSKGRMLAGKVSQGALRGSFRLSRGTSKVLQLFGLYRSSAGAVVTVVRAHGFPAWLTELPSGRTHGIGPSLTVGALLGDTSGDGSIVRDASGISWQGVHYERVALRQREVRVGAVAATLTLPPGAGPFPAAVMVHGSGPATREEFQTFTAYLASQGVAVLAGDKRGIGQSTGTYPGERASESTIAVLARDAEAETRFVAALPQIDRAAASGSSATARPGGSSRSRPSASMPCAGRSRSSARRSRPASRTRGARSRARARGRRAARARRCSRRCAQLGPSGVDPKPALAKLDIPVFWVYGDDDRNVPTELCVESLQKLKAGHDFTWTVLPVTHALLELPTGLYSSLSQSTGFVPALFPAIGEWLRSRGIVR